MSFENIYSERLILRQVRMEDAEAIHSYLSLPEVAKYSPVERKTIEEIIAFLEPLVSVEPETPGTWFAMAIILKESDQLIGNVSLRFPEKETYQVELGIAINPAYQKKGYAAEATLLVLQYAFEGLGKHRVFASIDPINESSIALVERVGMRREAHHRLSIMWKGDWADDVIYAMLASEWFERNKR
jgi:RimJ/RimL family protein N-acetyltransferase